MTALIGLDEINIMINCHIYLCKDKLNNICVIWSDPTQRTLTSCVLWPIRFVNVLPWGLESWIYRMWLESVGGVIMSVFGNFSMNCQVLKHSLPLLCLLDLPFFGIEWVRKQNKSSNYDTSVWNVTVSSSLLHDDLSHVASCSVLALKHPPLPSGWYLTKLSCSLRATPPPNAMLWASHAGWLD